MTQSIMPLDLNCPVVTARLCEEGKRRVHECLRAAFAVLSHACFHWTLKAETATFDGGTHVRQMNTFACSLEKLLLRSEDVRSDHVRLNK